ncbi:BA75_01094T0 [Komagataella pastoris]|uniref:Ubiquitin-conjugating enzyme E2 6 n=1 Tax=Komagataella pastoris TaxID=4922 RepID=A0A1B2J8H5_PICPA|nr:BA75_01094T0 [Komagataella pastoris]
MATKQAHRRLTKEYKLIQDNSPPFITAHPSESNILEWHYVIDGPPDTPYNNGQYHGVLLFPSEYPFKPPSIKMCTPNGRFQTNTKLCLSMSDFHPDLWNPGWSVSTILMGLLSFMTGSDSTTGSISTSDAVKVNLAKASKFYNACQNSAFQVQFPALAKQTIDQIHEDRLRESSEVRKLDHPTDIAEGIINIGEIEDPEDKVRYQIWKENESERADENNKSPASILSKLQYVLFFIFLGAVFKYYTH